MDRKELMRIVESLGKKLDFRVECEVPASTGAWVDVVWFDKRFAFTKPGTLKPMIRIPILPVVGIEIEAGTALNAKHIKGSVANLNNLGAQMGIIILGGHNVATMRSRAKKNESETEEKLWEMLISQVQQWVYAEAKPAGRIVIMTEDELVKWALKTGAIATTKSLSSLDEENLDHQGRT